MADDLADIEAARRYAALEARWKAEADAAWDRQAAVAQALENAETYVKRLRAVEHQREMEDLEEAEKKRRNLDSIRRMKERIAAKARAWAEEFGYMPIQ